MLIEHYLNDSVNEASKLKITIHDRHLRLLRLWALEDKKSIEGLLIAIITLYCADRVRKDFPDAEVITRLKK